MEFDKWLEENRTQMEQDFADDNQESFIEFCKSRFKR